MTIFIYFIMALFCYGYLKRQDEVKKEKRIGFDNVHRIIIIIIFSFFWPIFLGSVVYEIRNIKHPSITSSSSSSSSTG